MIIGSLKKDIIYKKEDVLFETDRNFRLDEYLSFKNTKELFVYSFQIRKDMILKRLEGIKSTSS
jgi:hypothetical protein